MLMVLLHVPCSWLQLESNEAVHMSSPGPSRSLLCLVCLVIVFIVVFMAFSMCLAGSNTVFGQAKVITPW